jgi:hypothetical protein
VAAPLGVASAEGVLPLLPVTLPLPLAVVVPQVAVAPATVTVGVALGLWEGEALTVPTDCVALSLALWVTRQLEAEWEGVSVPVGLTLAVAVGLLPPDCVAEAQALTLRVAPRVEVRLPEEVALALELALPPRAAAAAPPSPPVGLAKLAVWVTLGEELLEALELVVMVEVELAERLLRPLRAGEPEALPLLAPEAVRLHSPVPVCVGVAL